MLNLSKSFPPYILILKFFHSHISVVCSFFEFGMVSKWCISEWVKSICRRQAKCGSAHGGYFTRTGKHCGNRRKIIMLTSISPIHKMIPEGISSCTKPVPMNLRTGGRWFDSRLGHCFSGRLMIVIATGFILLSPMTNISTMVICGSSQWLERKTVRSTGRFNSLQDDKILDWSKLKQIADDILKCI